MCERTYAQMEQSLENCDQENDNFSLEKVGMGIFPFRAWGFDDLHVQILEIWGFNDVCVDGDLM